MLRPVTPGGVLFVTLLHQGVTSAKILICMLCITFSILTLCLRLLIQVRERPAEGEWWSPGGLGLLGVGGLLGRVGVLGVRGLLGGVGLCVGGLLGGGGVLGVLFVTLLHQGPT